MNAALVWLATLLNRVLRHFGLIVMRYPLPADRRRRALLQKYAVTVVVDIGANVGQYGARLRQLGYADSIISYEPLPDAYAALLKKCKKDQEWHAENKAVGITSGSVTVNVANNSESSSILPMLSRHINAAPNSHTIGTISAQTTTLDNILSGLHQSVRMIKIDTQGYERQILQSGLIHLQSATLIELEVSLLPLYSGQALFREIDSLLLSQGFRLISLEEGFFDERSGELLQMDAIYLNSRLADADVGAK